MFQFLQKIEYGNLRLQCSLAVQAILNFKTVEKPGEHGKGVFRVRLQPDVDAAQTAMEIQDGEVVFRYRLAGKSYGLTHKKEKTDMIGISLPGRVTDTAGEMCRLELDLEPGDTSTRLHRKRET